MRFSGQLLLPSEPGPGLQVDLEVGNHRLVVESDQETLGDWPLDTIHVRRVGGDVFAMTVANEDLHFVADDTVTFAYAGMAAIEQTNVPSPRRSPWRFVADLIRGPATSSFEPPEPDVLPSPSGSEGPASEETGARNPEIRFGTVAMNSDDPDQMGFIAEAIPPAAPPPSHRSDPTSLGEHDAPMDAESAAPQLQLTEATSGAAEDGTVGESEVDDSSTEAPGGLEPASQEPSVRSAKTGRCPALRNDGQPCRSPVIGPSGYCHPHDPNTPFRQDYNRALEARARMKRKGTARLTKIYSRLDRALNQVERGELAPDTAMAMAQLARTMCAILDLDETPPEDGPDPPRID